MKDKSMESSEIDKKANLSEYYGLEPEMSLQKAEFAPKENEYLNELAVDKDEQE